MNVAEGMRQLGIDKDNVRALGLLPLVFVAWADGTMQRAERALIRRIAQDKGWLTDGGQKLLDGWLAEAPSDDYVTTGLSLLRQLSVHKRGVSAAVTADTLDELLVLCRDVAQVAGGMWGLAESIAGSEDEALAAIAGALHIGDARTWRRIVADTESRTDRVVPGPPGHALLGDLPAVTKDPIGLVARCLRDYGDVVRIRMPGMEWYLISHPDHVKHVLVDNARNYVRGKSFDRFRLLVGKSIVTTEGDDWRPLRRTAQPAFHHQALAGMTAMMARCATEMVDGWAARGDDGPFDVAEEFNAVTLRIIGFALFGTDLQHEHTREFRDAMFVALDYAAGTANPFRLPASFPTPRNRRFKRAIKVFEEFVLDLLAQRRASGERHDDLLSMLLGATDPDTGEGLTDAQIHSDMLTYLLAGHETTATTLGWLFYALSKHPVVARRVDAELAEVLGGALPAFEHLDRLEYTERVICEAMRLYPAAFLMPRDVLAEDRIGGYVIPARSWVLLSAYATHRRPDIWPNPEGFDPDRFTPEAVAARSPYAFFPFFAGPHKCIGQALAMMEMKVLVAVVLQRCRLDLLPGLEPTMDAQVTLRVGGGLHVTPAWRE